ncbi:flagellar biosynthesis regulator FlaF [Dongia rigui]|uniref:Flagellar biosynthesis regulator FlaF n=2 Tax=Dongia rigui TaxID=940149 RepID=A0ABU5DU89_9PROT|nr:flagellar biosynthesis regulator FlaF [Dongia rigui]MDY0870547.1 flagellar biosynthesis regulator FlaF [Dongia rigui]
MDPRSTEAWALAEASRRLVLAARITDDNGEALRTALILNQRLWSIFQASLIDPSCELPKDIRDNVLALSILVDRHLMQRLGDLDGSKIQPILDINRSIAEGLSAQPERATDVGAAPAAPANPAPVTGKNAQPFMNLTA